MGKVTAAQRLMAWLAWKFGARYAGVLALVDRIVVVALAALGAKAVSSGITLPHLTQLSWWQALGDAGLVAALVAVQGVITTWLTGSPALGSLVSSTLRERRRTGHRVEHKVPLRPSRQVQHPTVPRKRA